MQIKLQVSFKNYLISFQDSYQILGATPQTTYCFQTNNNQITTKITKKSC